MNLVKRGNTITHKHLKNIETHIEREILVVQNILQLEGGDDVIREYVEENMKYTEFYYYSMNELGSFILSDMSVVGEMVDSIFDKCIEFKEYTKGHINIMSRALFNLFSNTVTIGFEDEVFLLIIRYFVCRHEGVVLEYGIN